MRVAILALSLSLLQGQTSTPNFLEGVTTSMVSMTSAQTAQINVLNTNPGGPPQVCTVGIEFRDAKNNLLRRTVIDNIPPGTSASLTLTAAQAGNFTTPRFPIRGIVRTDPASPPGSATQPLTGCPVVVSLEIWNTATGATQFVATDTHPLPVVALPLPQSGTP